MTTATLTAEVQLRIDALTASTPAAEILQNAVDTVGLSLDLTNIISVLNSATTAITSSTTADDVTALNAASIALGVTEKTAQSSSSEFTQDFISGFKHSFIPASFTGDVLVLTPPEDKAVRLTRLFSSNLQPNISITLGSRTVVNSLSLSSGVADGNFQVANDDSQHSHASIVGRVGEVLTVTRTSTATSSSTTQYSYEFGV